MVGAVGEVIDRLTLPARRSDNCKWTCWDCWRNTRRRWPGPVRQPWWKRPGELVAAIVAATGDAGVRLDRPRGDVHDAAHPFRYFPLLGFAGNRPRRLRGGKERGKNGGGDF